MMTRIGRSFLLTFLLAVVAVRSVDAQGLPSILSPREGEVLQGVVTIRGSSNYAGFLSSEVDFDYAGDTTGTWFLIATANQSVNSNTLANWDTTTITDGNYNLRLRVYLNDGTHLDVMIPNLRVRNYTPVETPTPAPTAIQPTLTPTDTLIPTPFPTPTALPANPAVLTSKEISTSLAFGSLGAVIFIFVFSIYLWLRRK
jgi:hypothetical protein